MPYSEWLRDVFESLHPVKRREHAKEMRDLRRLEADVSQAQIHAVPGNSAKRVLFIGMGNVSAVYLETFFRKSFELAGYRPSVLIPRKRVIQKAYKSLGQHDLVYLDQSLSLLPRRSGQVEALREFSDLLSCSYKGIRCGKYAASTLMRATRSGSFDFGSTRVQQIAAEAVAKSLEFADAAERMLDRNRPDAVVFVDRGYSPSGELFDACMQRAIPAYTWNAAHRNNAVLLKRYTVANADVHPASLSALSWEQIRRFPWSEDRWTRVHDELFGSYQSGEWYGEVGTQLNKALVPRDVLLQRLQLDATKKTAVIFPHIFWDATFFWGEDLFGDYETWFIEVLKAACRNTSLYWIIKVHPANLVKDARDGFYGEHSELVAIRKTVGALPPHVRLLAADTDISTYSLYRLMDYCLTVRGTVGIEAACFGIPVLTAGTGRYDRLGFTHDFDSREAYLAQVESLHLVPPMNVAQIELAQRYAYGVFLCRPARLESLKLEYRKDASAELVTALSEKAKQDIATCDDIRRIAEWISSGAEDYFELPSGDFGWRHDAGISAR